MNTKRLILTVGLPYSGKSTYAIKTGMPIVSPDAIRLALHGRRFEPLAEPFVWASAKLMVRSLFLAGHDFVVVDACNNTPKRRNQWVSSKEWDTVAEVFYTDYEVCKDRALKNADEEIIDVIERMFDEWDLEGIGPDGEPPVVHHVDLAVARSL